MWFIHQKKKTTSIYLLIGALAVLAVIGLLLAFSSARDRERVLQEERAAQLQKEEEKRTQALSDLAAVQNYQSYCTASVVRIDRSGDILRIVRSAGSTPIRYEREGKIFTCPNADQKENCVAATDGNFVTVYACPPITFNAAVSGDNGVMLKTQPAGPAVIVDRVILTDSSFIVIYPKTGESSLANSNLLPAGIHDIVSIAIPVRLQEGAIYRAELITDSGDGIFNEPDKPVLAADGTHLFVEFTADR
ncbi:MAG: hypothetical protein HY422_02915 [Candidatus Komeilibacteria bacterium]|nr:hypothetical protein [Candidatus Komeilibacteria bacterium]